MTNYNQTLRDAIRSRVKTPANPRISGAAMQVYLLSICDAIDAGGVFGGAVTPQSAAPSTEQNSFYLAKTAGTYTNFLDSQGSPLSLAVGEVAFLKTEIIKDGSIRWYKESVVTPNAPNGSVMYTVAQQLTEAEKSRALENIGAALADGENPNLVAGDIIPKSTSPVETVGQFAIQTTGGDVDLKSGASSIRSIRGNLDGMTPFLADMFVSTDMNLVDPMQTLTIEGRTAYYFPVAKGTWGSYGTTQENNGYIVIGSTPHAVCYSATKPTAMDYGKAITPVNSNGKKYYTTLGPGWMTVIMPEGSDTPAVHVAWSNYNDDVPGTFGNTVKNISPLVQWIHPWGMAALFGSSYAVFDKIDFVGQSCYRLTDRVALNSLEWSMATIPVSDDAIGFIMNTSSHHRSQP